MATIELTDVLFYKNGESKLGEDNVSSVVGYEDSSRRVARYTFTAPETGAQSVALTFHTSGRGSGSHMTLRFFIGTDPDSHVNAGAESEYTGELILDTNGYVVFNGTADILLLPNTVYYLWVFPSVDTFGWYTWQRQGYTSVMETEGVAGLIYIDNGSEHEAYQFYIDNGTSWDLYIPYIDNGNSWDMA